MGTRSYLLVSGAVFGLIAVLHLLRLVNQWPAQIAGWAVPAWVSWLGLIVGAVLCGWAFRLAGKRGV